MAPNDDTIQYIAFVKQKATNVVRQVLGFELTEETVIALRKYPFSLTKQLIEPLHNNWQW
jgi:hypothetical protein